MRRWIIRLVLWSLVIAALALGARWLSDELEHSRLQARYLSERARELTFKLESGKSDAIRFPRHGPYDERLGYSQLPGFIERLAANGFALTAQARMSDAMLETLDWGLYTVYREKDQAGLTLTDCTREPLYEVSFPERTYDRFESIPKLLVDSLLFIENRELLDDRAPTRNPAVEWDRFAKAVVDNALQKVIPGHEAAGGSTLATQTEKYRHSPEGRTNSAKDKLKQMASASLRAYLDGEDTRAYRKRIVLQYLNTVPLSAKPGYGEVNGLGDGLWAWYGRDFVEVSELLRAPRPNEDLDRKALAYKQSLSLMISERRPSFYLGDDASELNELTNAHLRLLGGAGIIQPALRDAALETPLAFRNDAVIRPPPSFVTRKAANSLRATLSGLLNVPRLYDLDRLDLAASSTLSGAAQRTVSDALRKVSEPTAARAAGLYGKNLFAEGDDPSKVVFSLTLYEAGAGANRLRLQTDSFDQPLDINSGAKLDLGSTAKLRTLISYLEIMSELHGRFVNATPAELARAETDRRDALSRWALEHLTSAHDRSLRAMLEAAMDRSYSANPNEPFFTGGGVHHFDNFDSTFDRRIITVREALRHSVNLPFIRLMRDIAYYYMFRTPGSSARILQDTADPRRQQYLEKFADKEGRQFVSRFYRKYRGKSAAEAEELLLSGMRLTPRRLAVTLRSIAPEMRPENFARAMRERLDEEDRPLSDRELQSLYDGYGPDKFSLGDRGYIAGVHPLEIWLVGFLRQHPGATLAQASEASRDERQVVYEWLFKTRHKNAQDSRIKSLLEVEAFLEIHRAWQRLGYPFESLTPSYASAIGAAADRPAALAELVGILVNRGLRKPIERLDALNFAQGTPYETRLAARPPAAERVLPEELTDIVRTALADVVQNGTAKRVAGAFKTPDGGAVQVGGKTGTGDHRFDVYGRGGVLISSRVVNRSATLVFFIGERWFGTITAFVREPYAARYSFTSGLVVQMLKTMAPALQPLLDPQKGLCRRPASASSQATQHGGNG